MGQFLLRLVLNAVALLLVAYFVPGVSITSFTGALVAALVLGIVNAILRPILVLLTLPVMIVTLGLFWFVINGVTFYFVGQLGIGLKVSSFWAAFVGAIVLTVVSFVLSTFTRAVEGPAP
jgi:putative membrane protein